jgi:hypothetical protein
MGRHASDGRFRGIADGPGVGAGPDGLRDRLAVRGLGQRDPPGTQRPAQSVTHPERSARRVANPHRDSSGPLASAASSR